MGERDAGNPMLVDTGSVPDRVAQYLARVDVLGEISRLVFSIERSIVEDGALALTNECAVNVIVPTASLTVIAAMIQGAAIAASISRPAASSKLM